MYLCVYIYLYAYAVGDSYWYIWWIYNLNITMNILMYCVNKCIRSHNQMIIWIPNYLQVQRTQLPEIGTSNTPSSTCVGSVSSCDSYIFLSILQYLVPFHKTPLLIRITIPLLSAESLFSSLSPGGSSCSTDLTEFPSGLKLFCVPGSWVPLWLTSKLWNAYKTISRLFASFWG